MFGKRLKRTALPKTPVIDPFCEHTSTFGKTKIEYLPITGEESPIIFKQAQQPFKIEHSAMVDTEGAIIVSTLSSTNKVGQDQIRSTCGTKNVATLSPKKSPILRTEIKTKNGCKKCAQLLAIERKVKDKIPTYKEKYETEEPIATEKLIHVCKLRKKLQLQRKIARRKREIVASSGEQLKMEHHRYGLLKNIANEQAEFVTETSYSKRPKTISKQIKEIFTINKPEMKQKFAFVYLIT